LGRVIVAGVGNTLAGDDGAGIYMVRELRKRLPESHSIKFLELEGDLYQIWDHLPGTDAILFLDAIAGDTPGEIKVGKTLPRAYTPSFHESDLSAVLKSLEMIYDGEFPKWTLWGVTIDPPRELGEGLSEPVSRGAAEVVKKLEALYRDNNLMIDGYAVGLSCTN
jgi:hydrogenase maturation protease